MSVGNDRNITGSDIEQFPVGDLAESSLPRRELSAVFAELMEDYKSNSFVRVRQDCEFQEFRPGMSKPIIDKNDQLLAQHYGFTDEESDFIINYDVKYRRGRDAEEEV